MSEIELLKGKVTKKLPKASRSAASMKKNFPPIIGVNSTVGCPRPIPVPGPAKVDRGGIIVSLKYSPKAKPGTVDLLIPWKVIGDALKRMG